MRRSIFIAALAGMSMLCNLAAAQENNPPIRLLVGFAAGGALDSVARAVADRLRVTLNQPIIVENKPGASQRLALSEIKRSKPDGLTLILANSSPFIIFPHVYPKLEFDPVKDFTPVAGVANFALCIAVGPKAPKGGLKELIGWAKAHPQDAAYATSGAGQMGHFLGLMFNNVSGANLIHVPYKGGAPAMTDLVGGQIPMMIDTILEPMEMAKSGKIRIIAVSGEKRLEVLPDVPTIRESGFDLSAEGFVGIYAPSGLPKDKLDRLNKALKEALASPDLKSRIQQYAMTPAYSTPEELTKRQTAGLAKWEAPIKASGFTAE